MDVITALSAFFFFAIYSIMAHGLMAVLAGIRIDTAQGEPPSALRITAAWLGAMCMVLLPPASYYMLKGAGLVAPLSAATGGVLLVVWFVSLLPGIFASRGMLKAAGIDPDATASVLN
ncbi:hypothetical protein [Ramlibacter albus]|uniref:Uncharacterized protein n=1 Tax=Ramlibacter albus TaxID=2079448 RepID=A0A923M377_9BURK|nr:hypothetical protein [Ramlibacter albus]MBC5763332.1 hypothetical protein [Ramlibacter albus]